MIKWCHIITFVLFVLKAIGIGFMASVGWMTVFTPMLMAWAFMLILFAIGLVAVSV